MCYVLSFTLQGLRADIVYLMDTSQYKMLAFPQVCYWVCIAADLTSTDILLPLLKLTDDTLI